MFECAQAALIFLATLHTIRQCVNEQDSNTQEKQRRRNFATIHLHFCIHLHSTLLHTLNTHTCRVCTSMSLPAKRRVSVTWTLPYERAAPLDAASLAAAIAAAAAARALPLLTLPPAAAEEDGPSAAALLPSLAGTVTCFCLCGATRPSCCCQVCTQIERWLEKVGFGAMSPTPHDAQDRFMVIQ